MTWQRTRIDVPENLSAKDRIRLADKVIDYIIQRTENGSGMKNGRKFRFPKYSKEYTQSLDFKIAGKKKGKVDLKLSGDMLAAIELLSHRKGSLLVGFENNTEENDKAEGNQKGTYGQPSPLPGKARPFLDVNKSELSALIRELN